VVGEAIGLHLLAEDNGRLAVALEAQRGRHVVAAAPERVAARGRSVAGSRNCKMCSAKEVYKYLARMLFRKSETKITQKGGLTDLKTFEIYKLFLRNEE
jgi:hypothetical protein